MADDKKLTTTPCESIKATPKVQLTIPKAKAGASRIPTIKKTMATRKHVDATPNKVSVNTINNATERTPAKLTMVSWESIKATPKVQLTIPKAKAKASPISTIKKKMATRKLVDVTPNKVSVNTVNNAACRTPEPKENKPVPTPSHVTKSRMKFWNPKPAHSGVPLPNKMLKLIRRILQAAEERFKV